MSRIYVETEIETDAGKVIVDAWVDFGCKGNRYEGRFGNPPCPDDEPEADIISSWYAQGGGDADLTNLEIEMAQEKLLEAAKEKLMDEE